MMSATSVTAASTRHEVIIDGTQFTPQNLEIKVGEKVTWINQDLFAHTATQKGAVGEGFDSQVIPPGKSWTHKFKKPGTLNYTCSMHPTMRAILIVK